jgi:hypothetical protein
VEVTVDYGEFPYKLEDGNILAAHSYRVKDNSAGGHSFSGSLKVEISLM